MLKLSIVVICWNDREVLENCLDSIYHETTQIAYEVILTDNRSTDGSLALVRNRFPGVRILESETNRGFGGANNRAFAQAQGEYVLILNPDTIILSRAIEKLIAYADGFPAAGAFGCRMLNADLSYQPSAYPTPSVSTYLVAAAYLRACGRFSRRFVADTYPQWTGSSEREVGFQAGCCLLVRQSVLDSVGGFDETLFHQFEDADLCLRMRRHGYATRFFPGAEVVHLGGQNRGRYPLPVILETHRSRYRFFAKHYGSVGARRIRWVTLLGLGLRFVGYSALRLTGLGVASRERLAALRMLLEWHAKIDPVKFIATGDEPDVGVAALSVPPAPSARASSDFS